MRKNMEKQLEKAIEPLHEFEGYWGVFDEEKAKSTLIKFFWDLSEIKTDKFLDIGHRNSYYSFYINLIPVMKALDNGQYALACHEILTLHHNERILQHRVYAGLMFLYRKYLEL